MSQGFDRSKVCEKKFWSLLTFYISPPVFLFQKIPLPRKRQTQDTDLGIFSVTFTGGALWKQNTFLGCLSLIFYKDLQGGTLPLCTPGYNKQWDQWAQKKVDSVNKAKEDAIRLLKILSCCRSERAWNSTRRSWSRRIFVYWRSTRRRSVGCTKRATRACKISGRTLKAARKCDGWYNSTYRGKL